jgi:hypothetical protein
MDEDYEKAFLKFLERDMANPHRLKSISPELLQYLKYLVADVEEDMTDHDKR